MAIHPSQIFSAPSTRTRARALTGATLTFVVAAGLTACAPAENQTPQDPPPATEAAPVPAPAPDEHTTGIGLPDAQNQPASGADAVTAATELIEINLRLLQTEDYAQACTLYRPAAAMQLLQSSAVDPATWDTVACESAMAEAFTDSVSEAFEVAKGLGEQPALPFYFVPAGVSIDASKLSADEEWLAYAPSGAVTAVDTTAFRDGSGGTPGWLTRSVYVQQGADGVWRFASAAERSDRG